MIYCYCLQEGVCTNNNKKKDEEEKLSAICKLAVTMKKVFCKKCINTHFFIQRRNNTLSHTAPLIPRSI